MIGQYYQGAEAGHKLGVDPELVKQVQLLVDHSVAGRNKQRQGEVEGLQDNKGLVQHLTQFYCQALVPKDHSQNLKPR